MDSEKVATITPLAGKNSGKEIEVIFNPTQYQVSETNQFAEVAIPGLGAPPIQFVRGNARTLSMQLFFDTYDPVLTRVTQGSDVRNYTNQITHLLVVDSKLHAPPICRFSWAAFVFEGVLEKADQRFTLFSKEGTPLRATIDVSFKEVGTEQMSGKGQAARTESADYTKRYVVQRGDTLSSISARKYGDPTRWRAIATENNLDNPLALTPGSVLVIPALV